MSNSDSIKVYKKCLTLIMGGAWVWIVLHNNVLRAEDSRQESKSVVIKNLFDNKKNIE